MSARDILSLYRQVTILNDASAAAVAEFAYRDSEETIAVLSELASASKMQRQSLWRS